MKVELLCKGWWWGELVSITRASHGFSFPPGSLCIPSKEPLSPENIETTSPVCQMQEKDWGLPKE